MREIKFRAWIENRKIMGKVTQIHFSRPNNPLVTLIGNKEGDGCWECSAILMQYTGLKANGKEIYEGDIVEVDEIGDERTIHSIVWNNDGMWEVKPSISYSDFEPNLGTLKNNAEGIEIIGNIYENPELLK